MLSDNTALNIDSLERAKAQVGSHDLLLTKEGKEALKFQASTVFAWTLMMM